MNKNKILETHRQQKYQATHQLLALHDNQLLLAHLRLSTLKLTDKNHSKSPNQTGINISMGMAHCIQSF